MTAVTRTNFNNLHPECAKEIGAEILILTRVSRIILCKDRRLPSRVRFLRVKTTKEGRNQIEILRSKIRGQACDFAILDQESTARKKIWEHRGN